VSTSTLSPSEMGTQNGSLYPSVLESILVSVAVALEEEMKYTR
jgi:hypothetical protein